MTHVSDFSRNKLVSFLGGRAADILISAIDYDLPDVLRVQLNPDGSVIDGAVGPMVTVETTEWAHVALWATAFGGRLFVRKLKYITEVQAVIRLSDGVIVCASNSMNAAETEKLAADNGLTTDQLAAGVQIDPEQYATLSAAAA